jgi:NAD(P)H-dependent FMN reductase
VTRPLYIVGFAGSLRQASYNRRLLATAADLAPPGVTIEIADYREVPGYDADLDDDTRRPTAVVELKRLVTAADGVLLATPEYNYGIPGVLKNVIDWISRPAYQSPFAGKDVAVMSAAPGQLGGVRAQAQLKYVLLGMAARPFAHPEVAVTKAGDKFDDDGLHDDATRDIVRKLLDAFAEHLRANVPRSPTQ